jgi:hypothetical protein
MFSASQKSTSHISNENQMVKGSTTPRALGGRKSKYKHWIFVLTYMPKLGIEFSYMPHSFETAIRVVFGDG